MKILHALVAVTLLVGCNNTAKTSGTAHTPEKTPVTDSAAEEAKIRQDSLLRIRKIFPFMAKYSFEVPAFKGVSP